MQTNPAVEQSKIIRWSENPWNRVGKEKVYGVVVRCLDTLLLLYWRCVLYKWLYFVTICNCEQ